jgi:pimeloyl-ACP methyl ester carboxylesterase
MTSICERLRAVKVPTLVVWTPEDRIQRVEHGARLAKAIPGAQLKLSAAIHPVFACSRFQKGCDG